MKKKYLLPDNALKPWAGNGRGSEEGETMAQMLFFMMLLMLLGVIGAISSYYLKSTLLLHISGILLTLLAIPDILSGSFLLIIFYVVAVFVSDVWYKAIYLVSLANASLHLITMVLRMVFAGGIAGLITIYDKFKAKK